MTSIRINNISLGGMTVPAQWNFLTLIIAAAVLSLAAMLITGVFTRYLEMIGGSKKRKLAALFGGAVGFMIWPVLGLLALRTLPSLRSWAASGPYPLNEVTGLPHTVGFVAVFIGGPVILLYYLQKNYLE